MFCKCYSGTVSGIDGVLVTVEADVRNGLPAFQIGGGTSGEAKESKDRIRIAIENSGFIMPPKHITVNLSPADVRKEGTSFDLPIAVAVLAAFGYIPEKNLSEYMFVGELSLDGKVRKVQNIFPLVFVAEKYGLKIVCPLENAREMTWTNGVHVIGINDIEQMADILYDNDCSKAFSLKTDYKTLVEPKERIGIFDALYTSEKVFRAIVLAASGGHNIFMAGNSTAIKKKLSTALAGLLPDLEMDEIVMLQKIHSFMDESCGVDNRPPYVSFSGSSSIGRTDILKADYGVFSLDDIGAAKSNSISVLSEVSNEHKARIRLSGTLNVIPCTNIFSYSASLCQCGSFPDDKCLCKSAKRGVRNAGISNFFIQNSDIFVTVNDLPINEMINRRGDEEKAFETVKTAREMQYARFGSRKKLNSHMSDEETLGICLLKQDCNELIDYLSEKGLSSEEYFKLLRLSRTVADTCGSAVIQREHILEAFSYRGREFI